MLTPPSVSIGRLRSRVKTGSPGVAGFTPYDVEHSSKEGAALTPWRNQATLVIGEQVQIADQGR